MKKRLLSIVLSCVMLLQLLPMVALATGTSSGQQIEVGQHVAMGKKDGRDLTWEILAIEDGKALLFSNYVLDFITIAKRNSANFNYCDSELNEWCENLLNSSFSEPEKEAICNILFLNKTECAQYVKSKRSLWPGLSGEMGAIGLGLVQATDNHCNIWLSSSQNGRWVDVFGWYDGELSFGTSANLTMYSGVYGACPAIALELDKVEFIGNGTFTSPYALRYDGGGTGNGTESGPVEITSFHPSNGQKDVDSTNLTPYLYYDRDVSHQSGKSVDLDFSKAPFTVYQAEDNKVIYQAKEDAGLRGTSSDIKVKAADHVVFFSGCTFEPGKTYYITMGEGFIKMADGTVSPEIKKGDWRFTTTGTSFSDEASVKVGTGVGGRTPVLDGVKWQDDWFATKSTKYNHELARTSMVLSAAAYVDSDNMTKVWQDLEFDSNNIKTYYEKSATNENNDFVAYSFAAKNLTGELNGTTLVAIAVRGTPSNAEWYSNFNIGEYTDSHIGFIRAASLLKEDLDLYLDTLKSQGYKIDKTTKFLVTGHSRGAAVANIVAMSLTAHQYSNQTNIFGYTFATPTVSTEATKDGYENIFNIVNEEDFVPQVPMEKWGFARYGLDLSLPSKSFYSSKSYSSVYDKMEKQFVSMTGKDEFHPYKNGTQDVQKLIKNVLFVSPDRVAYYDTPRRFYTNFSNIMLSEYKTTYEYFNVLATFLALPDGYKEKDDALLDLGVSLSGEFAGITGFFLLHEKFNQRVFDAHCPALYLSWMRSCTAEELFGSDNDEAVWNYRQATIACPVDVYVYNEAGTLVASVVNEEVVADTLAVSVQDGVKVVDLPADQEYRVEIKAREAGTVDYTVEEKSVGSTIDTTRTVFFDDITITKGDKLVGKITEEPSSQTYSLTKNNQTVITATSDSDAPSDLTFTDVTEKDWFYNDVKYVYENGLMNGVGEGLFGPGGTTTRGMIVTILYRLEGEPSTALSAFQDVASNQWYAKAVGWAADNGIVTGYSSSQFGPNDKITREQMAAILYRYAAYKGYDVSQRADLSKYEDQGTISSYAVDSMAWANGEGLINGIDADTLNPKGSAIRAQVAAILHRFCENIA